MALIDIQNLNKSFQKGEYQVQVLKEFSLTVDKGEQIAIVGSSGAGKSTLLHIIGGLEKADSGSILFDGEDISKKKGRELNLYRSETVGFVFQFHYLLDEFSAVENIMLPALIRGVDRKTAKADAEALLEKVGIGGRASHFPSELSGGEQQRTAIARAMMNKPKVLLADEPTGNLDRKNSDDVLNLFNIMQEEGVTIMMVTHDDTIADRCTRTVRLEKM